MTYKEKLDAANAAIKSGVETRAALLDALPVLTELIQANGGLRKRIKEAAEVEAKLSELCTEYAVEHQSVFDDKQMFTDQQGANYGEITIDDIVYRLTCGHRGYVPSAEGQLLTQDFLRGIPDEYLKTTTELAATAIKRAGLSDEDLADLCLKRKPVNVWTATEA